jgi:hypothetical protein
VFSKKFLEIEEHRTYPKLSPTLKALKKFFFLFCMNLKKFARDNKNDKIFYQNLSIKSLRQNFLTFKIKIGYNLLGRGHL